MNRNFIRAVACFSLFATLAAPRCAIDPGSTDSSSGLTTFSPNLILIFIDSLKADHLSLYGYQRNTSPNLNDLAKDAVVFEQMVNNGGFTLQVHTPMMTSLPPLVHNILFPTDPLGPERITLAE